MSSRVVMPKLTDTMEEGVVVKWRKREGEAVATGDVLAEIETDKAVMDLESFSSGILRKILASEGETVKAGTLIAVVAEPDEDIEPVLKQTTAPAPKPPAAAGSKESPQKKEAPRKPEAQPAAADRIKVSPRARAMAAERGIDLAAVKGTGPGGRIVERDLEAPREPAAKVPAGRPGDVTRPLSQMRKAIARATTQSKAPVPHFYLTIEIDMAEAERLRRLIKQTAGTHPSLNDLIIKAAAMALVRHPEINVSYEGEALRQHASIDIGVAVGLEDGLISPVLRNCGSKSLTQISAEMRDLIERARNKRLSPQEYTGATFSISNLGMYDVESFIAVLIPPEAAALAVGAVRDVTSLEDGTAKVSRRMKVTMSCDHRILDGLQGAKFLREFKRLLEHPLELVPPEEA
jgi:pyruvate dehydrogenase E2 component (dihydrolipoamide acetyltransferase)